MLEQQRANRGRLRTSAYGVLSLNDQSFPLASEPISLMMESEPSFPPATAVISYLRGARKMGNTHG